MSTPQENQKDEAPVILSAANLTKVFKGFVAVNGINLEVREGSIQALIGPNGAGKTTVFNLLTKFIKPTKGRIFFRGRDITSMNPAEVARLGVVRSFQISAVFPHLNVLDNIRVALQRQHGLARQFWLSRRTLSRLDERAEELLDSVNLGSFKAVGASELPYGRKRALEIATTLALDPTLLLLDEPMAGLGQEDIGVISELIRRIGQSRTVLMVEHNLSVVENLCSWVVVLRQGAVLAEGTYENVSADKRVLEAYIGSQHA